MSKPTNKPGWNPSSNVTEPSDSKKAAGYSVGEKPSSSNFNWLLKTISQWIDFIDSEGLQGAKGDTGAQGAQGETGPQGMDGAVNPTVIARMASLENKMGAQGVSPVTLSFPNGGDAPEGGEYDAGSVLPESTKEIDFSNGAFQGMILDADCSISFAGMVAGETYYLRVQQSGYGLKRIVGWPSNIIWAGNQVPVNSKESWKVDAFGFYFNGSNFFGFSSLNHLKVPNTLDNKMGYIAGGNVYVGSASYVATVEKMAFNSDTTLSVVQTEFGRELNTAGSLVYPTATTIASFGQGTQSSTHGYRMYAAYASLPTVNGQATSATHKLAFANDTGAIATIRNLSTSYAAIGGRRGLVQSSSNAYQRYNSNAGITTNYGKFNFATDVASNIVVSGYTSALYSVYEIGFNTDSYGSHLGGQGFQKLLFSNESSSTGTYLSPSDNGNGGHGEAVDGPYNGYFQKCTNETAPGVSTCYKVDKSSDTWNTLSGTLTGAGAASAAIQGNTAGYFCGGQIEAGSPGATGIASSVIKKMAYAPEVYSIHTASLGGNRQIGCGFEG